MKQEPYAPLKDALKEIGWGLRHAGCGHYQLINDRGKHTEFCINGTKLEYRSYKESAFGGEYKGMISLELEKCEILIDNVQTEKPQAVSVGSGGAWVSFYNFSNGATEDKNEHQ